jgi:large subunit ribosomal protein L7/L12
MATNPKLFAIADTLSKLTVLEAKELVDILEIEYGILPNMPTLNNGTVPVEKVVEIEQTEFNVYLKEAGGQKLQVIKKVKEIMGLGLKEAKELVDSTPCLLRGKVFKVEAETLRTELQNLGAIVEVR